MTHSRHLRYPLGASVSVAAMLMLTSCTVGPDYSRPATSQPAAYQPNSAATTQPALAAWWQQLNDPMLSRIIGQAVAGNLDLQAAEARVRQARASRQIAAAALWPDVNSQAGYTRSHLSKTTDSPPGSLLESGIFPADQDLYQAGFDASWELDVFGRTRRSIQAADARGQAAIEDRRDILLSVLGEVARNYVELRGAQRRLGVVETNIQLQSQTLKLVQDRRANGRATDLDVQQAKAQLEQTQSALPLLRANIRASAYRLGVLTGQAPAALLGTLLEAPPPLTVPDIVPVGLPSDLLRRRPDLRRADRELAAATAEIGVAKADLYPQFFLTGTAGLQSAKFADLFQANSFAWSLGPSIRWPVFDGGRIKGNIAYTEARRDEVVSRYRQRVLLAVEDVEASLVRYAERQLETRQLAQARQDQFRAVELIRIQYRHGVRDLFSVLDAEQRLNELDNRLAISQTAGMGELVSLYKALGGGWELYEPPTTMPAEQVRQ